ncbi:OmpA family protein [Neogemmobacter tilapiae]|uniref:Membrane protein n=1 Tax=Neogemmobacter tilapiae TaxID=875041 RepID=A0A918TQ89_9RHOB|nr:OmpA family protein [Gemmobacter tilapiae]GHC56114.1 membrane protein [Gemmobacter tilapiae]
MKRILSALTLMMATPALAFTPKFPGPATQTGSFQEPLTSYRLPIGPYGAEGLPHEPLEGAFDQTSWRLATPGLSTLSLLAPMRDQLRAEGWDILFECETESCGGFDFRYGTDVLPEPDMHVDLTDFRFLSARRMGGEGAEYLSLLISRSTESGFVQRILLTPAGALPEVEEIPDLTTPETIAPLRPITPVAGTLGSQLETGGAQALDDLVFPSGSSELAPGDYASLSELVAYLQANPDRRIALVGHTDASGSLAPNIALSKKRAASVRAALMALGAEGGRIAAEGVGYLAPRDSNETPEGRTRNRRVEVMLLAGD